MPVRFGVCINSRNCNYSTALILPKHIENYTLLNSVIVQKVPWGFSKSTLYPKGPLTWNHFIFVTLRRKTWKCVSASSIYIFSVGSISISSMGKKKREKEVPAATYRHLLSILMNGCPSEHDTHILLACTPNKKDLCNHILKYSVEMKDIGSIMVPSKEFQTSNLLKCKSRGDKE